VTEAKKKLAIIDGKSVFYRGYYAMPNLSTKEGVPTGGVFGFMNSTTTRPMILWAH
jgi:5'-3' exonuclease